MKEKRYNNKKLRQGEAMADRREGGSIPGFVIMAIILVGLLLGGAYFLQQQNHHKPVTITPIPDRQEEAEQKPAESVPPPASSVPQTPGSSSSNSTPQATHLPQSGPTDGILPAIYIGLSTLVVLSYLRSRRQLGASLTY